MTIKKITAAQNCKDRRLGPWHKTAAEDRQESCKYVKGKPSDSDPRQDILKTIQETQKAVT